MTDAGVINAADVPILVRFSAAEWAAYILGVEHGFADGLDRGRAIAEAELADDWSALAAKIRTAANVPTHAELTVRRRWAE